MSNQILGQQVQQSSSSDVAGLLTFASGASASIVYNTPYVSTPIVVLTPVNPGATSFTLTSTSRTGFTVTSAGAAGKGVNWHAIGNPT